MRFRIRVAPGNTSVRYEPESEPHANAKGPAVAGAVRLFTPQADDVAEL